MANRTKFWHFNTSGGFYGELLSNTGLTDTPENRAQALVSTDNGCYHYIVFIKETDQIYTHGNLYDCSTFNGSEVKSLLTGLTSGEILDNDKAMTIIAKLHYLINQNAGNIAVLESEKADKSEVEILRANVEENAEVTAKALNDLNDAIADIDVSEVSSLIERVDTNEEVTSAAINDLYSKINSVPESTGEENVQSDWNENDVYSDAYIKNKPAIPNAVTSSTVSGWGFTKNTGTYSKPSTGIPKSDLASAVQTSLNKADSAVASVKINGSTKNPSNGVVDLGTVITSHQDISGKQDKLISGTNIKTINNQSILGSGDITISGGGSSDKVEVVGIYPEVDGDTWIYHIPAGKFVELVPLNGATAPSYAHLELLDPVEYTLEDESDWATEYSKYHFTMYGLN